MEAPCWGPPSAAHQESSAANLLALAQGCMSCARPGPIEHFNRACCATCYVERRPAALAGWRVWLDPPEGVSARVALACPGCVPHLVAAGFRVARTVAL
jgi:hypothetical protein